ncbi:MAG: Ku protein [Bryobacterales bacterium]|nr:Ku protein [Bryobacterales bacterium]
MASTTWKGHITFGMVSIPVKMTVAARPETVSFNQLHKADHSRVKQVLFSASTDKPVPRSELVKGYEYEKDRYVIIEEEDIKKIQPKTAKVMEILEFVPASELDPVYLESSYYLQPDEAGEKAYTLLYAAMKDSGQYALAKITMHNREHMVVLRPGRHGVCLHTMYYQDDVRAMDEFRTNTGVLNEKELLMAKSLVMALGGHFEPEKYKDTYRDSLRNMIEAKVKGQDVVAPPAAQELAPVIDIMEALKTSLAALKKPAAVEADADQDEPEQQMLLTGTNDAAPARKPRKKA